MWEHRWRWDLAEPAMTAGDWGLPLRVRAGVMSPNTSPINAAGEARGVYRVLDEVPPDSRQERVQDGPADFGGVRPPAEYRRPFDGTLSPAGLAALAGNGAGGNPRLGGRG